MAKRKHRLVIEVTFNHELTDKKAVWAAQLLLDRIDLQAKPIWANASDVYAEKVQVKSFYRVIRGLFSTKTLEAVTSRWVRTKGRDAK